MKALYVLVGVVLLAISSSHGEAAVGGFQEIDAELVDRAVIMQLPDGVRRVRVRFLNEEGEWETCTIAHLRGSEGYLKLRLPDGIENENIEVAASWSDPLPFEFYQGDSKFEPSEVSDGGVRAGTSGPVELSDATTDGSTVEESDIWKWRDRTLYFFNQYRGLQVIDVSDSSNPERLASLRIPFSGEQLYLHPSEPGVVLLTYDPVTNGGKVLTVEHTGDNQLRQQSSVPVPGYILESRMVGSVLYVISQQTWQERVVDPDTGAEHIKWESGLNVSKMDLSDPANPVAADPLELKNGKYDYWGAQVQATPETLLISTNSYDSVLRQSTSTVHVVDISDPDEAPALRHHVAISGQVLDKFSMQIKGNILTVVSQVWRWQNTRQRWASVETFDLSDAHEDLEESLAQLEFANDESITATRFSGNLLYVVTVLQMDPLFIIDLANPSDPRLLGELEVPGFSTHLEPYGEDSLISVGIEGNQLAVSWFDVANQGEPSLKSRVYVGEEEGWTWSEANWDEKAFGFFPEEHLILLPYQGSVPDVGWMNGIQIIEIGEEELIKRGSIEHEFKARRARVVEDSVVSISGQSLKTLDISDPDNPALLSDLILAWPVDYIHRVGENLVQIERGQNFYGFYGIGSNSQARLQVSPIEDPDESVASLDLPEGDVVGSHLLGEVLLVAQHDVQWIEKEEGPSETIEQFRTTIVDLSDPEKPTLLGSVSDSRSNDGNYYGSGSSYRGDLLPDGNFVWYPSGQNSYYFLDYGFGRDFTGYPYYSSGGRVYTVDIEDKENLQILSCTNLVSENVIRNPWPEGKPQLFDGKFYFGLQNSESVEEEGQSSRWVNRHWLGQLDLQDSAHPKRLSSIEIPGSFEQITSNEEGGLFLLTSKYHSFNDAGTLKTELRIQASAFDGVQAFLIDELVEEEYRYGPKLINDRFIVLSKLDHRADTSQTTLTTYEWQSTGSFVRHHSHRYVDGLYRLEVIDDILIANGWKELRFIDFRNPAEPGGNVLSFPSVNHWGSRGFIDIFERAWAYVPLGWFGVESLDFDGAFDVVETLGKVRALADESEEWLPVNLESLRQTHATSDQEIGILEASRQWVYSDSVERYEYGVWIRRAFNLGENDGVPSMDEDSDGDGLSNGLEFLTGSNPGDVGDASPIESWTTFDSEGSRYVFFRWDRNLSASGEGELVPQYSDDLENWAIEPGMFETSQDLFSTSSVIRYIEPLGIREQRFFRLFMPSDN